ncbi:MAG TPA: NAD-binding protein [Candidatus Baltobacteraceae bacterium]|nr:NAD-binding protein [Candidatus Baltobacteraceae bacterium]
MFILIVGGGKVGTYLASALLGQNHEVVVIEKDARKSKLMSSILENDIAVIGDGCDPAVLIQSGIERSDVVVADTGDDEDNLVVCLIAKKLSTARCIARVNNPRNKAIFASIDHEHPIAVISSTEVILEAIDEYVNAGTASIIARLQDGKIELARLKVTPGSPAAGRAIRDISLPRDSVIVALERSGTDVIVPNSETILTGGDAVIVLARRDRRDDIRAALGIERTVSSVPQS